METTRYQRYLRQIERVSVNSRRGIAVAQRFASRRLWGQSDIGDPSASGSKDAVYLVAMVGLAFEARIAAGPGVFVVCRGEHDPSDLMQFAAREGCRCMLSFGVAGGLHPDLQPGDCIVASAVIDAKIMRPTDPTWSRKLLEMTPGMRHGYVAGVNSIVQNPAAKRELRARTGAVAVDMESHLVARAAARHGLAFAALRVIVDPAHRTVPDAILTAARFRGSACLTALMRELMARPSEISALCRIALDGYAARSTLLRLRRELGPRFGFSEFNELRRDLRESNAIEL